jgi:hypothetical protein
MIRNIELEADLLHAFNSENVAITHRKTAILQGITQPREKMATGNKEQSHARKLSVWSDQV